MPSPNRGEGHILISPFRSTREVSQCRSRAVTTARLSHQPQHVPARFCRADCTPSPGGWGLKTSQGWTWASTGLRATLGTWTYRKVQMGWDWKINAPDGPSGLLISDPDRLNTALAAALASLPKASCLSLILRKPAIFNADPHAWSVQCN